MKTKPGIVLGSLDNQAKGTAFKNARGFDPKDRTLGNDTIPGPAVGAPLMQTRIVDDYDARKTVYARGISPGSLNDPMHVSPSGPTLQRDVNTKAPTLDAPVPGSAERPVNLARIRSRPSAPWIWGFSR